MDLSFDINNSKGDHVLVALSNYDKTFLDAITNDPEVHELTYYEISLSRIDGDGPVGYNVLGQICRILADFLFANERAVLCFYCDGTTEIERHHKAIPPQEYRSLLFTRMFEMFVKRNHTDELANYQVIVTHNNDHWQSEYAHFICRKYHLPIIKRISNLLMIK